MSLPFETSYNIWYVQIPVYEWEPVASPAPPGTADAPEAADATGTGDADSPTLQCQAEAMPSPLQLVFKGYDWQACTLGYQRDNPSWDLCVRNRIDEADERAQEHDRHAHRPSIPQAGQSPASAIGSVPSWDAPHSPEAAGGAKLDASKGPDDHDPTL